MGAGNGSIAAHLRLSASSDVSRVLGDSGNGHFGTCHAPGGRGPIDGRQIPKPGGAMSRYVRPGFLISHVANPIMRRLRRTPALIVRGRRSGRTLTVPMGQPLDLNGQRYLVSGRGETHWV